MDDNLNPIDGFPEQVQVSCTTDSYVCGKRIADLIIAESTLNIIGDGLCMDGETKHIDYPDFGEIGTEDLDSCRLCVAREMIWREEDFNNISCLSHFARLTRVDCKTGGRTNELVAGLRVLAAKKMVRQVVKGADQGSLRTLTARVWEVAIYYKIPDELLLHVGSPEERIFVQSNIAELDKMEKTSRRSTGCQNAAEAAILVICEGARLNWKQVYDMMSEFESTPLLRCMIYSLYGLQLSVLGQQTECIFALDQAATVKYDAVILDYCRLASSIMLKCSCMTSDFLMMERNVDRVDPNIRLLMFNAAYKFENVATTEDGESLKIAYERLCAEAYSVAVRNIPLPWFTISQVSATLAKMSLTETGETVGWSLREMLLGPRLLELDDLERKLLEWIIVPETKKQTIKTLCRFGLCQDTRTIGMLELERRRFEWGECKNEISDRLRACFLAKPDIMYCYDVAELMIAVEGEKKKVNRQ